MWILSSIFIMCSCNHRHYAGAIFNYYRFYLILFYFSFNCYHFGFSSVLLSLDFRFFVSLLHRLDFSIRTKKSFELMICHSSKWYTFLYVCIKSCLFFRIKLTVQRLQKTQFSMKSFPWIWCVFGVYDILKFLFKAKSTPHFASPFYRFQTEYSRQLIRNLFTNSLFIRYHFLCALISVFLLNKTHIDEIYLFTSVSVPYTWNIYILYIILYIL